MTNTRSRGFTIIEVMIVLAVMGLIILLVFQAIPTLTRNSRNNQRKQDVALILSAVSHYELVNSANFPAPPVTVAQVLTGSKLTNYDITANQVTFTAQTGSTAANKSPHTGADGSGNPALNWVEVVNYARCLSDGSGGTTKSGADYTDIVALYAIETSGGSSPKCAQL